MKWNIIRYLENGKTYYGNRPRNHNSFDEENNNDKTLLPKIPCLIRYNKEKLKTHYGKNAFLVKNYIDKLYYDPNTDSWFDSEDNYQCDFESDDIEAYILLENLDSILCGSPEPEWCWSYGETLAKTSVPALNKWIKKGYSHPVNLDEDTWEEILEKIKHAFEVSIEDFENDITIKPNMSDEEKQQIIKEHEALLEEHKQFRKEAFALMAEYYLNLWD